MVNKVAQTPGVVKPQLMRGPVDGRTPSEDESRFSPVTRAGHASVPPMEDARCDCGRAWNGRAQCHCAAPNCHRHFASESAFAAHQSTKGCEDPLTLLRRCGCPRLSLVMLAGGPTWEAAPHLGACLRLDGRRRSQSLPPAGVRVRPGRRIPQRAT